MGLKRVKGEVTSERKSGSAVAHKGNTSEVEHTRVVQTHIGAKQCKAKQNTVQSLLFLYIQYIVSTAQMNTLCFGGEKVERERDMEIKKESEREI